MHTYIPEVEVKGPLRRLPVRGVRPVLGKVVCRVEDDADAALVSLSFFGGVAFD